jgi:predicted enzyme related to lactoylglutathione lyase
VAGMGILRGIATVNFWANDHAAAKAWYTEFIGIEPYFERPGYVEFRIGDYQHELGIIDAAYGPPQPDRAAGAIVYWHVDDLQATFDRLIEMGATQYEKVTPRGDNGFVTASVVDPFGNILGIMTNPHYLQVLQG